MGEQLTVLDEATGLDEADTVATCVGKACRALAEGGIAGEVIVADNGSTDGSPALAERAGARVVPVASKGYGAALMGGIAAARGRYVIMGDAAQRIVVRDFDAMGGLVRKSGAVAN